MNRNLTLALSLAAGLLGGWLSHYATLPTVHAQAPAPNALELRAQSFALVDDQGSAMGTFMVRESAPLVLRGPGYPEPNRKVIAPPTRSPRIVLVDPQGREIWSAGGNPFRSLTENLK